MFWSSADIYDKIYSFKDYAGETRRLLEIIGEHLPPERRRLLDVACGTGLHLEHFAKELDVEGLDLCEELLEHARRRLPATPFHRADMTDFALGREFDVVTCLFSSIGYVKTLEALRRAVDCMARHVARGGLLLLEPWFVPEAWKPGTVYAVLVLDEPELKIARVNTSFVDGRLSWFDLHYLVATPAGTEHFVERHELGLFEENEMRDAFVQAGLEVSYDPEGLTGRGLYVGRRGR